MLGSMFGLYSTTTITNQRLCPKNPIIIYCLVFNMILVQNWPSRKDYSFYKVQDLSTSTVAGFVGNAVKKNVIIYFFNSIENKTKRCCPKNPII